MAKQAKTASRGYGSKHQTERARVKRELVDPGLAYCWRCGGWIDPSQPWDLGHDDHDRTLYRGPEHRGRECPAGGNRATYHRRTTKQRRWDL
jgi:hypothetical protein